MSDLSSVFENLSYDSILFIIVHLEKKETRYIIEFQDNFTKKKIKRILDPIIYEQLIEIPFDRKIIFKNLDEKINSLKNKLATVCFNRPQKNFLYFLYYKQLRLKFYKMVARTITDSSSVLNIFKTKTLLKYISDVFYYEGFYSMENLLEHDGIQEDFFAWLLTKVLLGEKLNLAIEQNDYSNKVSSRYGKIVIEILLLIATMEYPYKIGKIIDEI
jgi:hypothetical protein